MPPTFTPAQERRVLLLMALLQFINIWDFMIVMPMGPDFARALGIDAGSISWIAGSYSVAAAFIGFASASFLDRFDRRSVLLFNLCGLALATAATIFATTTGQLMAVRAVTGLFGGTMISSSLAVIADVFPPQRRGEAMGKVFGSFSVASVLGVPVGLEMATHLGWQSPFMLISGMALLAALCIWFNLPPMRFHLERSGVQPPLFDSLRHNASALPAAGMIGLSLLGAFLIIPNISAHVQLNMGYPREQLGLLYFCGGMAAFFSMRWAGKMSDRVGYTKTAFVGTLVLVATLYAGFYAQIHAVPVLLVFILFMISMSTRNVTINALVSRIPSPQERAGFMALMSSVQSLFSGLGSFVSSALLFEQDGRLGGMSEVALLAMGCFVLSLAVMGRIEKQVKARGA